LTWRLDVPAHLHRNSKRVADAGYEETGQLLIDFAIRRLGLETLASADILDVGCGVRFVQTIINRRIPVGSYTGIEVYRPIVDFLKTHVEARDARFRFAHWDVRHALFHPEGAVALADAPLPVSGSFDVIWLYSVFTHLDETDMRAMLRHLRPALRPGGRLLFTAFVDPHLDGFESRSPEHPLQMMFVGARTMEGLLRDTGWTPLRFHPVGDEPFIQPCYVCVREDAAATS
jgi:SAM-dependent methyltransferase